MDVSHQSTEYGWCECLLEYRAYCAYARMHFIFGHIAQYISLSMHNQLQNCKGVCESCT